VARSRACP